MTDHATVLEKIASLPPAVVLGTSLMGYNWQAIFYLASTVWIVIQIIFKLRKEWRKRRIVYVPDTDKAAL